MSYLTGIFKKGVCAIFTGLVTPNYAGKTMIHPDYEILDDEDDDENLLNFKRIAPVYSETEGLHQKYIRKVMKRSAGSIFTLYRFTVPAEICQKKSAQHS